MSVTTESVRGLDNLLIDYFLLQNTRVVTAEIFETVIEDMLFEKWSVVINRIISEVCHAKRG